jgi:glutaredoxin
MARGNTIISMTCGIALALAAGAALAQSQVYRYVDKDGKVVYTDRLPPDAAKDVQAKRLGGNFVQSDDMSLATREATERFPVKLYTFPCGEVCRAAEALLNRRGVPYTSIAVDTPEGSELLMKATGELQAPVLQIGDKQFAKGYSEARWTSMLDEAGYPKAPANRRASPVGKSAPDAMPVAPVAGDASQTVNAPANYPKQ